VDKDRGLLRALTECELLHDIVLHLHRCRSRESDDRRRPERRDVLAEHTVIRPEIVTPLRNTVGLVDRDEPGLAPGQHLRKARNAQPLRRNEQEIERAVEVGPAGLPCVFAAQPGVDAGDTEAQIVKLRRLVVHQGDQRGDDQRRAAARNRGQLVAERLARARRHHEQHVSTRVCRAGAGNDWLEGIAKV
jgi:hypothetical protein